ncbi:YhdP family protein [Marinobacter zhanjiangensis]|uniref:TIGR02099 family protein n=1 Tax=Marinobacter zhanjiangensis TaxID=578215 RepID=A0ABQ3AX63_9GAMM|nr:YhdP family protein [Marinobacter zhanjiangensis]GGY69391.1 TIGR02099 family protein [Marinobacter zhanjiangensis]
MTEQTPAPAGKNPERKPRTRAAGLLLKAAVWLLVFLLIIVALGTAGARYMARHIDDYRPAIEALLSERLGQEVTISGLSASWQGPDPVLQASRLDIAHHSRDDASAVALQHLLLRLDGPRSLLRMGLVFQRIEADGLDLVVTRGAGTDIGIEGLRLPESGPGLSETGGLSGEQWLQPQRWLNELAGRISDPEIRLTHLTVGLQTPDAETLFVDIPQLDLAYDDERLSASGRAMRQGTLEQLVTFSIQGTDLFEGRFTGKVWADITPGGILEAATRGLQWRHFQLQGLDASATTWLSFENGRLERLNGRIDMPRLELDSDLATLPAIEALAARIGWRRTAEGGELTVQDLQWRWQDEAVTGLSLKLGYDRLRYRVAAADLPLGLLARMAVESNLLPARVEPEVAGLSPEGRLSLLHLMLPRDDPGEFEVSAVFDEAGVQPHRGAPGGRNLQGRLWLSRDGGRFRVEGKDMTLLVPNLYAQPLTFSHTEGEVAWRNEGGITRVFGRNLEVTHGETTRANGAFDLRLDRYGEDNLGLRIAVANAPASKLSVFLPSRVLDQQLYDWLTRAVTGGELVSGEFYGHGQIGDGRPKSSFSTAMEYRFRDASIRYEPSWPEVTGASGTVTIHDRDTRVVLDKATTGGVALGGAEVEVVQGADAPTVRVSTSARLTGEQAGYWLRETPLGRMAGDVGQSLSVSGDYDLDLSLWVPLAVGQDVGVEASLQTENGGLLYSPANLRWQNIRGAVSYSSENGISEDPLSAHFLGQPVGIRLRTDPGRGALTIIQSGQTSVASLTAALMPQGQSLPGLSGWLPYTARLDVVPGADAQLAVTTNGSGVRSEWPAPLSREPGPDETIEALLRWPEGDQLLLEAQWGQRLSAALEWQGDRFRSGQVVMGNDSARFQVEDGLMVRAAFDRFAPARWQDWLERLGVGISGSSSGAEGTGERFDWLNNIDLRMDELLLGDSAIPGLRIMARPQPDGWLLTTNSERATGRVRIPDSGDRVWVDLDRLRLARGQESAPDEAAALLTPSEQLDAFRGMAAGQWPEVEVRIASLEMENDPAGSWSFVLSPSPDQVTLRDLQGRIGSLVFDGQLRWGVTSGEQITVVQGVLEGGGLQDLSNLLGQQMPLTNQNSVVDLNVAWPGRPDQFAAGRLNGEFSVRLDDGVILQNSETAQLFRLFNLLNTDTLQRRLQFDFSDLYEAGVAFDAIYGKAKLEHGVLTWNPDLQLAGPSGALRLSGLTNLADETLNMRLVVILPLTQNLPLAAILMGASPPVGGALFVLDKLLGEPLSKLTSATYSVRGTWNDPDVKLRNIFDSGNRE